MRNCQTSPYRSTSPRVTQNSNSSYALGSPIFSSRKSEGFPTPELPPNMFRSPQASIIRSPSYGIASHHFTLNGQERFVLETPKADKRCVDLILEGKPTSPPSQPMNTLRYVFPVLMFISFFLLFIIPQFALVFIISIIGYFINQYFIRKENKKRMNQAPSFTFPTPRRF